jgi:urea carboxylase-associated protein 2
MTDPAILHETVIEGGKHWSFTARRGTKLRLTDIAGGANVGMLLYNPANILERYNAPDTLKCQHTFRLTQGHCLYSDMGRIFCSIVADTVGWHDTVAGNIDKTTIAERWGLKSYQDHKNDWTQNGHDAFLVEGGKYGLGRRDLAANVNWFSKVVPGADGTITLDPFNSPAGASVDLRFEMDTLVLLHTCPHPMSQAAEYPRNPVGLQLSKAPPVAADDYCMNFRPENRRGFQNNALYHLCGADAGGHSC